METQKKFTVIAQKWFDKINGNTYHSVRCIRHTDGSIIVGAMRYGYGSAYEQTALKIMLEAGWLPIYLENSIKNFDSLVRLTKENVMQYERNWDYPIIWVVSNGLKRECIENGTL